MRLKHAPDVEDLEVLPPDWDEGADGDLPRYLDSRLARPANARRHRGLWLLLTAATVAALVGWGTAISLRHDVADSRQQVRELQQRQPTRPTVRAPLAPPVAGQAFTAHPTTIRGHGRVAIADAGHLRVIDGTADTARDLYRMGTVEYPAWSPSGEWLSFGVDSTHVWLARPDLSGASEVGLVSQVGEDTVAWSPVADHLAIATVSGIRIVTLAGQLGPGSPLLLGGGSGREASMAWAPDGHTIAFVSSSKGQPDRLFRQSLDGRQAEPVGLATEADDQLIVAGWWPDSRGLLVWQQPRHSASLASDGMQLVSVPLDGGPTIPLATTLPYRSWLSWSPDGRHLALIEGAGREATRGKQLAICDVPRGACRPVPLTPGTVALDPAWSPNGGDIAFVQAHEEDDGGYGNWLATHELWAVGPDGAAPRPLGVALRGASRPIWSPDSQLLLVEVWNRLWLVQPRTFAAPVAEPVYQSEFPPGYYYGFVDWARTFAWHPG